MLTISKPLSSTQAQTYHAKEFTAAEQNYWKQEDIIQGEWRGKLADKFELSQRQRVGVHGSLGRAVGWNKSTRHKRQSRRHIHDD